MTNECMGLLGDWLGHKYQPRYDTNHLPPKSVDCKGLERKYAFSSYDLERIIGANTDKTSTYVHDVCVRCGDVRKR
jgi:hypothetical protein